MKSSLKPYKQQELVGRIQLVAVSFAGLLSGIGIAGTYTGAELVVVSRFMMMVYAGVLAFATPWAMFPQVSVYLYQSLNPQPSTLVRLLFRRLRVVYLPAIAMMLAIPMWGAMQSDGQAAFVLILAVENLTGVIGLTLYASYRYLRVGPVSQLWQEGKLGKNMLKSLEESGKSTGVPAGSIPTITTTVVVAAFGMLAVVLGAWLQGISGIPLNAAGALLLGFAGLFGWMKSSRTADVTFFHAHAFYQELFRNPGGSADGGRDPLPHAALYWVPRNIRTLVWTMLRQMDRKVPVGRLVITGIVVYWMLLYSGVQDTLIVILSPVIILAAKNALMLRMGQAVFTPVRFQQQLGTTTQWLLARLFAGLRWSFPMAAGLGLAAWLSPIVNSHMLFFWISADLILVIGTAAYMNRILTHRLRYQFN